MSPRLKNRAWFLLHIHKVGLSLELLMSHKTSQHQTVYSRARFPRWKVQIEGLILWLDKRKQTGPPDL